MSATVAVPVLDLTFGRSVLAGGSPAQNLTLGSAEGMTVFRAVRCLPSVQ